MALHEFKRQIVTALSAVSLLSIVAAGTAAAVEHNWGAGAWGGEETRCTSVNDGHALASKSECGPQDGEHHMYVDPDVFDSFETALSTSLFWDYDYGVSIATTHDAVLGSNTDVRVRSVDIPFQVPWIYTTCALDATYGGGTGYYRWCRQHILRFDPTRDNGCVDSGNDCRHWAACHELGHTLGLQHTGTYPEETDSQRSSCLGYNKTYRNPDARDIEHLEDCVVDRPSPVPYYRNYHCLQFGQ